MSRGKLLALGGAGVAVLIVLIAVLLMQNLDLLVRRLIENYGSEAAGTPVRVAEVRIDLAERRGTLRGLTVANPPGYSQAALYALDDITLVIDAASITSDIPVINELRIGTAAFRYEVDAQGRSNLDVIQASLKRSDSKDPRPDQETASKRVKIKKLVIAGGEATVDLGKVGIGRMTTRVPGATLTNLGGQQGLTATELSQAVLGALSRNLERSLTNAGIGKLIRQTKGSSLEQLMQGLLGR